MRKKSNQRAFITPLVSWSRNKSPMIENNIMR